MSAGNTDILGVLVAVQEELIAIRKLMPQVETQSTGGIVIYRGKLGGHDVALVKSGMGSQRAYRAARSLIQLITPSEVLIGGFCAGLRANLAPGHLVVATGIFEAQAAKPGSGGPVRAMLTTAGNGVHAILRPEERMMERASTISTGFEVCKGAILTVPQIVGSSADKKRYAKSSPVAALDMESFGAATACQSLKIPWLVVRAVTDGLEDDLPFDFARFTGPGGEVSRVGIAMHVAGRPSLVGPMIKLGKRSALAAKNLGTFVELFARKRMDQK